MPSDRSSAGGDVGRVFESDYTSQVDNESGPILDSTTTTTMQVSAYAHQNDSTVSMNVGRLFGNWRRSFASPRLAFLDLLDNAFDAAQIGNIDVSTDENYVIIANTCVEEVPSMDSIMCLFASEKRGDAIGENGIGLKQASAALSDTTLVCFRRNDTVGISLLDKTLFSEHSDLLKVEFAVSSTSVSKLSLTLMDDIIAHLVPSSGLDCPAVQAIGRFGGGLFELGIKKIHDCVMSLFLNRWLGSESPHSFLVALRNPNCIITPELVNKSYLHPDPACTVTVNGTRVPFSHWTNRLVELSDYIAPISKNVIWHDDRNWDDKEEEDNESNVYNLPIYLGFDPIVAKGKENAMELYIYSRRVGRLVKSYPDARKYVGIYATGAHYCQGLVVIVDDVEGHLPLNPTKQNISFANEGTCGMVHEENIRAWLKCASYIFWNWHARKFNMLKTDLRSAVCEYFDMAVRLTMKPPMCSLNNSDYTDFADTAVYRRQRKGKYDALMPTNNRIVANETENTKWKIRAKNEPGDDDDAVREARKVKKKQTARKVYRGPLNENAARSKSKKRKAPKPRMGQMQRRNAAFLLNLHM